MKRRAATAEEARALANPLRLRILRLCLDRGMTNKELAVRLGKDPGTILHHVRMLVETGFLAAEPERRGARGAVERPYRATGKSWTLDVGDSSSTNTAMVDAFRGEVAEIGPRDVHTMSRLAVKLRPADRKAFVERIQALTEELYAADDPTGEPYGYFVALHRRHDDDQPPGRPPGGRRAPSRRGQPTRGATSEQ